MDEKLSAISKYNLWNGNIIESGAPRKSYTEKISQYIGNRIIKVLIGQRRAGKSYIMRQIANNLLTSGVSSHNILFINKELSVFDFISNNSDLKNLVKTFIQEFKPLGKIYLFIDEIQEIESWEKAINSLSQDYTLDCEIFITGSNSHLLSGELSTFLSGRYIEFQVQTLSFDEYSTIKKLPHDKQSYIKYMNDGGFPELLHFSTEEAKRNYISSLKNTILLKDIIQRYTIKDVILLDDIFAYLVNNASNLLSIPNIVNFLKSKGRKTSYETVSNYIGYIENVFLTHKTERFNIKGKEILSGNHKYYTNDIAFKNYLYNGFGYGIGYLLENLVYLDLRRAGYDIYTGKLNDKEVDFVAIKNDRTIYIQSAYILADEDTIKREYSPLELINDNYEKIVVSLDDIKLPSKEGIKHIQAWDLLNYLQ